MLIGRLTRDPESIASGAGARFGFAVNNRKLNQQTQQWEEVPVFIDMEIWNRGESKQADRVLQTLRRGHQVYVEGHLKLDQWDDKNGAGKRSALRVVVEMFQYLEKKEESQTQYHRPPQQRPAPQRQAPAPQHGGYVVGGDPYDDPHGDGPDRDRPGWRNDDEEIPF